MVVDPEREVVGPGREVVELDPKRGFKLELDPKRGVEREVGNL